MTLGRGWWCCHCNRSCPGTAAYVVAAWWRGWLCLGPALSIGLECKSHVVHCRVGRRGSGAAPCTGRRMWQVVLVRPHSSTWVVTRCHQHVSAAAGLSTCMHGAVPCVQVCAARPHLWWSCCVCHLGFVVVPTNQLILWATPSGGTVVVTGICVQGSMLLGSTYPSQAWCWGRGFPMYASMCAHACCKDFLGNTKTWCCTAAAFMPCGAPATVLSELWLLLEHTSGTCGRMQAAKRWHSWHCGCVVT